ncbi:MAG: cysteine desulfurase [Clostridiales bacterium]|nr:cysteine desulfurase [Clostridiales bacterium]
MEAYLDNSATTRPGGAVRALAEELLSSGWYNPSALYKPALEIQKRMDAARETCLKAAGAAGCRIIFTSGGTESDNLALLGHMRSRRQAGRVLISSVEHPAVSACAEELKRMGHRVEEIPAGKDGRVDLEKLEEMLDGEVALISVMQVNNETGGIEPLAEIAEIRRRKCPGAAIHVDGVQGFMRVPLNFRKLGIQSYALSGHKIHGLKGTGALITAPDHPIRPLQFGGGQEGNLRSGTENTFGILALGEAVRGWKAEDTEKIRELKIRLWSEIKQKVPEADVNGPDPGSPESAPHILNVALEPVRSQTMLFALEGDGIFVSAGSACASRKQKISPVLKAMGVQTARADCSLRFSLSRETTEEEILYAAGRVGAQYDILKKYVRR